MQLLPAPFSLAPLFLPYLSFLAAAVSAILALTMFEALMGGAANRRRMPGALWASGLLVLLAGLGLILSFRGVSAHLAAAGPPSGTTPIEGAGGLGRLLALVDQLPPCGVALITLGAVLVTAALRRPDPSRDGAAPTPRQTREPASADALQHLRQVKAELKGRKGEDAVVVLLARLCVPALHDVILPDARGLTQVDHLVRLRDRIAVLETKAYAGFITGTPRSPEWTQHLQGSRHKAAFQNPLLQNHRHTEAVRAMAGPGVPVIGLVVSAGTAKFCPELVDSVVPLENLTAHLFGSPSADDGPADLGMAWHRLTAAAERSLGLKSEHLEQVRASSLVR